MRRQVENEVNNTWDSWEHIVEGKLRDLDYLLDHVRNEFSLCGLSFKYSDEWIEKKIDEVRSRIKSERSVLRRENMKAMRKMMEGYQ